MTFMRFWVLLVFCGLVSCRKHREIAVYQVDKNQPHPVQVDVHPDEHATIPPVAEPSESEANPHAALKSEAAMAVKDEAPADWEKGKATPLRMVSYRVKGADGAELDISFSMLRSAAGSLLNNINRWRDQLGQPAIDEATLNQTVIKVPTGFGEGVLVDVEGVSVQSDSKKDGRIIGVIAESGGRAWFYKMRGNAMLASAQKQAFIQWVASVRPEVPATPEPVQVSPTELTWILPDGWKANFGGNSRYATLEVPGNPPSSVVVSFFPGDVGGDVSNINRWRGQIMMPAVDETEALRSIVQVRAESKVFSLVDLQGEQSRMLAAWVRHGGNTWFFKWTGTALNEELFRSFLSSVRFNTPES